MVSITVVNQSLFTAPDSVTDRRTDMIHWLRLRPTVTGGRAWSASPRSINHCLLLQTARPTYGQTWYTGYASVWPWQVVKHGQHHSGQSITVYSSGHTDRRDTLAMPPSDRDRWSSMVSITVVNQSLFIAPDIRTDVIHWLCLRLTVTGGQAWSASQWSINHCLQLRTARPQHTYILI